MAAGAVGGRRGRLRLLVVVDLLVVVMVAAVVGREGRGRVLLVLLGVVGDALWAVRRGVLGVVRVVVMVSGVRGSCGRG